MDDIYVNGAYERSNPAWHEGDSPWKAARIAEVLDAHGISPQRVCEVGSGSGRILTELAGRYPRARFTGYEISPQAHALAVSRTTNRVNFVLGDATAAQGPYDLVLVVDVVEHVPDCFEFLRGVKSMGATTVLHIPLDLSAQSVARERPLMELRRSVGHVHSFTRGTALALLEDCGFEVLHTRYTASRLELPDQAISSRLVAPLRRVAHRVAPDLAVRVLGGYSLLVLAR